MYKLKTTVAIVVYSINCCFWITFGSATPPFRPPSKTAKSSEIIRPVSYLFIAVVIYYSVLKMAAEKGAWQNRKWSKSGSLSLLTST